MDYEIDVNQDENYLYAKYIGKFTSDEIPEEIGEELLKQGRKLDDSWNLIADLREVRSVRSEVSDIIDKFQELLDEHGVEQVVRIVDPDDKVTQMSFEVGGAYEYEVKKAESLEEARDILISD